MDPIQYADERGIWREDRPGHPYGILWTEIYRVCGSKLDCITEVDTVLELDWEYGEYLELNSRWQGFEQVAQALTDRLPGIAPDWYQQVAALGVDEEPLTVWKQDAQAAE